MVDDPSIDDAEDVEVDVEQEVDRTMESGGEPDGQPRHGDSEAPPDPIPSDAPTIPGKGLFDDDDDDDDDDDEAESLDGDDVVESKSIPPPKRPVPPSRRPAKSIPPRPDKKTAPLPSSRPLSRPPGSRISKPPPAPSSGPPSASTSSKPPSRLSDSPLSRPPDIGGDDDWERPAKPPRMPTDLGLGGQTNMVPADEESVDGPPAAEALTALTLGDFDDEPFDGAKTQKLVRRTAHPDEAAADAVKKKARKGRRRIVQIPDDDVPTTTAPEEPSLDEEEVDDDATTQLRMPAATASGETEAVDDADEGDDIDAEGHLDRTTATLLEEAEELEEDLLVEEDDDGEEAQEGEELDAEELDAEELAPDHPVTPPPAPSSRPVEEKDQFVTDGSIGLVRPIQIVSDLPAMASGDATMEVEPEAILPAPPAAGAEGVESGPKRPPPPRRPETSEVDPEERRPPPPPRAEMTSSEVTSTEMTAAEADLVLAEARAKEALAKAKQAEARAREAAAKASRKKPWWAQMFEDELIRTLDNPKKKDVERDATFVEKTLRLEPGARVLDLACGTGVHAVELASRGYQVVGVDYSPTMLELAKQYNNQRGASVSFIQGDMRKLNLEEVFDGIYCWASSFGFFDDAANANVLERVARALRPGGTFTLDVTNRDFVSARAPNMAWFEKPGVVCMDDMRFDFYASRLINKRMVLFDSGKSREIETSIRLYTLHELGRLMHKVGFKVLEVSGHRATRGAYFGAESPQIIITGQRRSD